MAGLLVEGVAEAAAVGGPVWPVPATPAGSPVDGEGPAGWSAAAILITSNADNGRGRLETVLRTSVSIRTKKSRGDTHSSGGLMYLSRAQLEAIFG